MICSSDKKRSFDARRLLTRVAMLLTGLVLLGGCNSGEPSAAKPSSPTTDAPPPPPPTVPAAQPTPPGAATPAATPASPPAEPAKPATVQTEAKVGVGAKGRGYGAGPIATPAAVFFSARERIAFDISIPQAMNLFKASEGHAPQSHEEFMEKIIKANQIPLPDLPEGHRYVYDPKKEQLLVEKPAE